MTNPASGVFKQLAYKVETTFGTIPAQASAQSLRRVQSTVDISKDTYSSSEIRTDFQVADFRHGVRRVGGKIEGELSAKTYSELIGYAMKRDFATVTALTAVGLTVAGAGPTYTLTRAAGDYISAGFKVGMVIRLTVGALNADNLARNLLIVTLTTTIATVLPLSSGAFTVAGPTYPVAGNTITVTGKVNYIPATGHLDKSFAIEHWHPDVTQSEVFLGCKVDKVSINLPATGMATIGLDIIGQDMAETLAKRGAVATTTQYFTSPTAATTTGVMAAVNGVLRMAGAAVATVTGLTLELDPAFSGDPAVGSNIVPFLFPGTVKVSGQVTAYFDSATLRDAFIAETEIDLIAAFTADNTATADFISIALPRIKLGGSSKNDGQVGLLQTLPFTALMNTAGGAAVSTEKTTIQIQDSAM